MHGNADPRRLQSGREIPTESYSDQPYIVQTDDGAWLCCVTTGPGAEGARGQHVTTLRSTDEGKSWSAPVPVEPPDSPENSYAVMLKVPGAKPHAEAPTLVPPRRDHPSQEGTPDSLLPSWEGWPQAGVGRLAPVGRVYIFYNHNTDRVREVRRDDGKAPYQRVDSLGHFVLKFSDDHGRTWSGRRFDIPVRLFQCDRENVYGGALCFFWNVGKPFIHQGAAYVSLHKVGRMGEGFFAQSEGVLLRSANLLTEPDPDRIVWETLPDGEVGLRTPPGGGPIAEEQSYSVLSDGSFYCVYRSIDGHPVEAYSRDGGHTWSTPRYKCYADGRRMKHPRAANFAWRCANGKFLYWFHNHGGVFIGRDPNAINTAYEDRNPVWLSGGIEADSPDGRIILWSQPEIGLYDDDPYVRISYPDLVEAGGKYFLTETQKETARVHEVPADLLAGMWQGLEQRAARPQPVSDAVLLALPEFGRPMPATAPMPALPYGTQDLRQGFALDLWLRPDSLSPGQMILDSRTAWGQGLALATTPRKTLQLILNDGRCDCRWESDPVLAEGRLHHAVVNVDGGPKIISFVVDGRFCDGGEWRPFGWGRFNAALQHARGEQTLRIGARLEGQVHALRIYNRALRTFEAMQNQLAGSTP